jgi:hypothetical protein
MARSLRTNERTNERTARHLKLTPLLAALLAVFPVASPQPATAAESSSAPASAATGNPQNNTLPDLAQPLPSQTSVRPSGNGIALDSADANSRFSANIETSQNTGASAGVGGAWTVGDIGALGGGVRMGGNLSELFINLGLRLGDTQQLILTGGQLKQDLEFSFPSGNSRANMTQYSGGASWRFNLDNGIIDYAEANAYTSRTASRDLADKTYAVDTATLYELWNDPRRIAGGSITGLQGRLGLKPWGSGRINLGFGQENLQYDLLTGTDKHNRTTGSFGLEQTLDGQTKLRFDADTAAAQNRIRLGLDYRSGTAGTLGVDLVSIRGRDNAPNDSRVQIRWTIPLERYASASAATPDSTALHPGYTSSSPDAAQRNPGTDHRSPNAAQRNPGTSPAWGNLLDRAAIRPSWMPSQVIAKLDTTAAPTRLIAVDKTALPVGSSVNIATGIITTPLGIIATGIASVTLNAAPFVNSGQFALSGNNLITDPNKITQPAVGVTDTYVVTVSISGGGTLLATVTVTHGSVKVDSIVISSGVVAAAPTASAVSISGTTQAGQLLTGSYTYADANGDPQGTSTFRWLRNGVAIVGATASTYTLVAADVGNPITFEVTPVSTVAPTTGTAVASAATAAVTLPAGYVSQGGLTWMPNNAGSATFGGDFNNWGIPGGYTDWNTANTYCTSATILGQTGWRLPTTTELSALYSSGAINAQGWALYDAWSSTPLGAGVHEIVYLLDGIVDWSLDALNNYVTCVR